MQNSAPQSSIPSSTLDPASGTGLSAYAGFDKRSLVLQGQLRFEQDLGQYCHGKWLKPGGSQPILIRHSYLLAQGDYAPVLQGLSLRLCSSQGAWDLIMHNSPFFMADQSQEFYGFMAAMQSGEASLLAWVLAHANAWRFWLWLQHSQLNPMLTEAHGVHAFALWNANSERTWVKFRLLAEPNATGFGLALKWRLQCQLMSEQQAKQQPNCFRASYLWPTEQYPWQDWACIELSPEPLAEAQTQALAFSLGNILPGMGFSPDPLLDQRLAEYALAQEERLAKDYRQQGSNASAAWSEQNSQALSPLASMPCDLALQQAAQYFQSLSPEAKTWILARLEQAAQGLALSSVECEQLARVFAHHLPDWSSK